MTLTSDILEEIAFRFSDLDLDRTRELTKEAVKRGYQAHRILDEGLAKGLNLVGKRFETKEYFLADLMVASHIMEKAMAEIEDKLKIEVKDSEQRGRIVFGTVEGDYHFIGKNITISLLRASGYEVYDLGEDVPPQKFVNKVKEVKPDIVAMSSLLLTTLPGIGEVVDALNKAGLRNQVYIIIGGRPTSQAIAKKYGADAYCETAMDGVATANKYMASKGGK